MVEFEITQATAVSAIPVFALRGDIDLSAAQILKPELMKPLDGGAAGLVLDITDVDRIDSSGWTTLLDVRTRVTDRGGQVVLVGVNDHVRLHLRMTGLRALFPEAETSQEAAAMAARAPE